MVNYDSIAPYYDTLARLVFGNTQLDAEAYYSRGIPNGSRVLIVGGGTGRLLPLLDALDTSELAIVYVEQSAKMLAIAQRRTTKHIKVEFVQKSVQEYAANRQFDYIITSFFFDNFSDSTIASLLAHLAKMLKENGKWIQTDFQIPQQFPWSWLAKGLEKCMYTFFQVTSGVQRSHFPDPRLMFMDNSLRLLEECFFYKGMICTALYTYAPIKVMDK